jgi:hypothetical protein
LKISSEVCHPRCVFKLYGEVNSVKNTTINVWLNDSVYWQCKNLMFRPIAVTFRVDNFLAKRVLYNMPKPRGDVEISSSFYVLLLTF